MHGWLQLINAFHPMDNRWPSFLVLRAKTSASRPRSQQFCLGSLTDFELHGSKSFLYHLYWFSTERFFSSSSPCSPGFKHKVKPRRPSKREASMSKPGPRISQDIPGLPGKCSQTRHLAMPCYAYVSVRQDLLDLLELLGESCIEF